jgi:hypothetical protein
LRELVYQEFGCSQYVNLCETKFPSLSERGKAEVL